MRAKRLVAALAIAAAASAGGLAAGTAVAAPVPTTAVVQTTAVHQAELLPVRKTAAAPNDNWFFDGAVHPYGNPHWCFFGALSSTIAIVTGTPVVLEKCRSTSKHLPVGGEYWHGYRIRAVGQMFLLAKPNYVLGRLNRKPPTVFVPFEYLRNADAFIAFLKDKHGHWHISLTDQKNKKPYYLIMPEHLKASVTAYAMKWHEGDLPMPKGWTDIVTGMNWEQVQTV